MSFGILKTSLDIFEIEFQDFEKQFHQFQIEFWPPQALATFTTYASYPAPDCLSQNFVQCGQAISQHDAFLSMTGVTKNIGELVQLNEATNVTSNVRV